MNKTQSFFLEKSNLDWITGALELIKNSKHLSAREAYVLEQRIKDVTFEDMARIHGLTKQRWQAIEVNALRKLNKYNLPIDNAILPL